MAEEQLKFDRFDQIFTEEDFFLSDYVGAEELLGVPWNLCMIAKCEDEDLFIEFYYEIEGKFEVEITSGNLRYMIMDKLEVVLLDDYEMKAIIIKTKDKQDFENFL